MKLTPKEAYDALATLCKKFQNTLKSNAHILEIEDIPYEFQSSKSPLKKIQTKADGAQITLQPGSAHETFSAKSAEVKIKALIEDILDAQEKFTQILSEIPLCKSLKTSTFVEVYIDDVHSDFTPFISFYFDKKADHAFFGSYMYNVQTESSHIKKRLDLLNSLDNSFSPKDPQWLIYTNSDFTKNIKIKSTDIHTYQAPDAQTALKIFVAIKHSEILVTNKSFKSQRIKVLQYVPDEDLGSSAEWMKDIRKKNLLQS
jgi:hypothetical protein